MRTKLPSLTARWVTLLRAISNENPLLNDFSDPIALRLLSPKMIRIAKDGAKRLDQKGTFPEFLRHAALQIQFRTVVIDYAIRKNRPFNQLVILGAGLDSRAWRMQELNNVKVYEVDHPATQAWKKEQVKKIEGERQAEEVKFVAVDFTKDDLSLKLEEAGFDRKKKSFWIWEGVTMYLEEGDVRKTMKMISELSEGGGGLALTYLNATKGRNVAFGLNTLLKVVGEPLKSFYEFKEFECLAQECGPWSTIRHVNYTNLDCSIKNRSNWLIRLVLGEKELHETVWIGEVQKK
eukprot:gene10173-11060_t